MKKIWFLVLVLMLVSVPSFARKRCHDKDGKFVSCASVADASAVAAAPTAAASGVVPASPVPPVASSGGVQVINRVSKKGKVYKQCRDAKTKRFVKCPS